MTSLFTPRPYHAILLAFLLFLAVGPLLSAEAATSKAEHVALQEGPEKPDWREKNVGKQFARVLHSPIREVREDALVTMINLSQEKQYDLTAAVPALLGVFTETRHPKEQRMAATALGLIGNEASIEALITLAEEEHDEKLRGHARRAIAVYYLTAYPELAKEFEEDKDGRISYAKIQKAKRDHARALRRAKVASL